MNKVFYIYASIIFASATGFFVLWLAVRLLEPLEYLAFGAFWAGVYFIVGSVSGLQQEVARASSQSSEDKQEAKQEINSSAKLAAISIGFFFIISFALAAVIFLVSGPAKNTELLDVFPPLAIGIIGYILVAVIGGSLFGIHNWTLVAIMISIDATLRLFFVAFALFFANDFLILYWAVSIPFGLSVILIAPLLVRALRGKVITDVPLRKMILNSVQAIAAAVGMSLLLNGFPLILSSTTKDVGNEILSQSMFAVTLIRAPFIVIAISLQSLLLVKFKAQANLRQTILQISIWFLFSTMLILFLGYFCIYQIFDLVIGRTVLLSQLLLTSIILSGLMLSLLVVIGAAVLSRSLHFIYALGWASAAGISFAMLLVPLEFEVRLIMALLVGPLVGLIIQSIGLSKKNFRTEDFYKRYK